MLVLHVGQRPGESGVGSEPEVRPVVELSSLEGKVTNGVLRKVAYVSALVIS